jgi:peptidyl-prolyl cis-trans isomerase C
MSERLKGWLREPLVHFLIGGVLVFLFFAWRGTEADPESRRIIVSEELVTQLTARFEQTMQRAPSQAEIDGIIRDHIKEEVYAREAMRLGLDADDSVIRRRLRAKMEYLARAEAEAVVPDDATLQAWIDKNPARYAADAEYSFDQIYLGSDTNNENAVRSALRAGQDWSRLGAPISLVQSMESATASEIKTAFGEQFASAQAGLKTGEWSAPVQSGFGYHLIRVRKASAKTKPQLATIRQRVGNDWRAATVADREAKAYQALLDGYTIKIAKP